MRRARHRDEIEIFETSPKDGCHRGSMTTSFTRDSRQLAETYDRVSETQVEAGKRLVERLRLEEGARVLDVGCGTGRLAESIAGRDGAKGSVVGHHSLEERIRTA